MIARVQIARKELGIEESAYRAMLERLTGRTSAKDLDQHQLGLVLDELKAKGWRPKVARPAAPAADRAPSDHPQARKARALWLSLHSLGVVRDPSEAALESFARRQLKVEALQWADKGRVYKLIEALKAIAERAGWSQAGTSDEIRARLAEMLRAKAA